MLLEKIKNKFHKISYRLAFVYLCFLIPCFLFAYLSLNYLTSNYLEKRDHDIIEVKIQQLNDLFENEGINGLKRIITDIKLHNQSIRFLIQLYDPTGNIIFVHLPEDSQNFDLSNLSNIIKNAKKTKGDYWYKSPARGGEEEILEFKLIPLNGNYKLLIGASTDDRDDLLEQFRSIFFFIMASFFIISFIGVIYIAQKILTPLSTLNHSIIDIKNGRLSSRVKLPKFKDELYDLSLIFNQMINQIELLVKALNETVDNIAHDLKTPISRSRITAEIALQNGTYDELKNASEETIENCDKILAIIHAILTTARYDAKAVKLNKIFFKIDDLIDELVNLYFFIAEEKSITIGINCHDTIIWADRIILKQAIANILDNAIKYSPSNAKIQISSIENENEYTIQILDEGPGIPSDEISKIWERLYRGDKSRHEPGLGLGLSLVKVFIESHDGQISVKSELGIGTLFTISLPKQKRFDTLNS